MADSNFLKLLDDHEFWREIERSNFFNPGAPPTKEWSPQVTFQELYAPGALNALIKDSDKIQGLLACKIFWQSYFGVVNTTSTRYYEIGRHILSTAKLLHSETRLFVQNEATRTGESSTLEASTAEFNATSIVVPTNSHPRAKSWTVQEIQQVYKKMVDGLDGQEPNPFILATALMYLTTARFANGTRDQMSAYYAGAGRTLLKKLHLFPLLVPPPQKSFYDLILDAMCKHPEREQLVAAVILERETTTSSVVREYLDETCLSALSGYGLGLIVWLKRASARLGWSNDKLVKSLWFGRNIGAMDYINEFLQDADRDPYVYYARVLYEGHYPWLNVKKFKLTALTFAMISEGIDKHPERYPSFAQCSSGDIQEAQKVSMCLHDFSRT